MHEGLRSSRGKRGVVKLSAEPVASSNKRIIFIPKCNLLPKKNQKKKFLCFCKPEPDNPYLLIERESQASDESKESWIRVYQSDDDLYAD